MLTLSQRPHRFADLVGQDSARIVLQALVFAGDVPAALLFGGASGTGKTSAARILAAALNCELPDNGDCCGVCRACRAVQHGGVADIRALTELAHYATGGPWRVIVLDEAHAMGRSAFHALLKTLEEPPPRTVFVLCTTEPDKIMPTVRSRAMPITFHPVPAAAIATRLRAVCTREDITISQQALEVIAEHAEGGVRDAVMLLDQARRVGAVTTAQLDVLLGRSTRPASLVTALVNGDHAGAREHLAGYFAESADTAALIGEVITDLQGRFVNHTLSHQRLVAATRLLWESRSIPASPARVARSQFEALATLLLAVLAESTPAAVRPIPRVEKSPKSPDDAGLELDELVDFLTAD
jgi:DNA polymerase III subunit gamma/tau